MMMMMISSFSLSHHLYADDTQLFISFQPTKFNENISCLQTALSAISDWMTDFKPPLLQQC